MSQLKCLMPMVLALSLGGCTQIATTAQPADAITREQVLSGNLLLGNVAAAPLPALDVLAVDADMREFLDRYIDRRANKFLRLQQLVYAVITESTFGLEYTEATRTAAETFRKRNGNCLSFTNMFVAMARDVGLSVAFQEIDIPPDWEQHGDTLILNRHINVLVELGADSKKAVDFNIDDFKSSYERHKVSDQRAQAHYYSNVGVERLQVGDYLGAFRYLRKGIEVDARFSPLWTNLGSLYLRNAHLRHAEFSYLEALRQDARDMVAISNLERVYERLGDVQHQQAYHRLARYHRERNPYYRFHQAREAFLKRDYVSALEHLKFAIRKKPAEDSFYFLRGLTYLQMGDSEQARIDLHKAENVAGDEQLKRNYHSKMEMLMSEQK